MGATSRVRISNLAIVMLGAEPIMSPTEGSQQAIIANLFWDQNLKTVLEMFPWNCARAQASIAALTTTPEYGYDYQYELPVSPWCLRVIGMDGDYDYRIVGRKLETDAESPISIEFTKLITDYNELDAMVVEVIAARLAWKMAYRITRSRKVEEDMKNLFYESFAQAKLEDARTGITTVDEIDTWITARS